MFSVDFHVSADYETKTIPITCQIVDTYKTNAFTWVKRNKINTNTWFWGNGHYTRANAELCLLATKGKVLPRLSRSVHSVIATPVEEHSKKPDVVRDRIVELFGNIPRIELFARQRVDGCVSRHQKWDS